MNGFKPTDTSSPGSQLELELFGFCAFFSEEPKRLPFADAVVHAYVNQPAGWNPLHPKTEWSRRLIDTVRTFLPAEKAPEVALYLSLGTSLDWWFGVDAFLLLEDGIATLDVTTNQALKKTTRFKHFIFCRTALYDNWEERCQEVADKVSRPFPGIAQALARFRP